MFKTANAFASHLVRLIRWKFLPKVFATVLGLGLFLLSGFHWSVFLIYLAVAFWSYLSFVREERELLRFSFFLLIFGAPFSLFVIYGFFPDIHFLVPISLFIVFSVLLGFMFGFFQSFFEDRRLVFRIVQSSLLFLSLLFLSFVHSFADFWFSPISLFWFLSLFIVSVILIREFFRFFRVFPGLSGWFWSIFSGFLSVQLGWVLLLLPISFLGVSLILSAFLLLSREGLMAHFSSTLSGRNLLFGVFGLFFLLLASFLL